MPPLYRLLSARYVWHRWDRAALIVASIALGVATLVSARVLNRMVDVAATNTTTPLKAADLYVSNGELGVLRRVADDLRAANVAGVEAVQPLVFDRVTLPALDDRPAVLLGTELSVSLLDGANPLGVTVELTGEGPVLQLAPVFAAVKAGEFARAAELWDRIPGRLILVSRALYDERKARGGAGQPLVLRSGTRQLRCLPVGVFDIAGESPLAALGRSVIGMEINQAARFVKAGPPPGAAAVAGGMADPGWEVAYPPRVNRIDLRLAPTADAATALADVSRIVGDRATVNTPETQGRSTQEIVGGVQVSFLLCSAGAMVVGLFLVYNALSVTVAERRHDIGILRSIGATRFQIIKLFAAAAVILGLLGSALGVPLGAGLARFAMGEFKEELGAMFLSAELNPAIPTVGTVLLGFLAGVATAVCAALIPAIQAASDEPADAVRRGPGRGGPWRVAHRATCATLVAGGVAMILTRHDLPHRVGAFGGMMAALVGLLLAAPIIVGQLVRVTQPILRRVLPIEARLAADNLIRSPGRTGVVIGALGAGVAVMVQTAGVGKSNEVPVVRWIDELIQADRFVFAGTLVEATSSQTPIDPDTVKALGKLPGLERVTGIRYVRPEYNGTIVFLMAIDAGGFADGTQKRAPGGAPELDKLRRIAGREAVVVSENFARRHGVRVGDTVTLPGPAGPVRLPVADTIRDYSWSRGSLFIDRPVYARLFRDDVLDVCHVFFADPPTADAAVAKFAADRGLLVTDRPTVRNFFAGLIDRVYALAYLQQIVVGIVAALGVVTALLISVLQRKRELGLLLAVGATPAQVIRSVLAEAALMGGFGTVLGVLIGLPMQWYVLAVILREESGFVFDLVFPWAAAAVISVGALTVATLAGLLPALHAVRTRIPDAIAYE